MPRSGICAIPAKIWLTSHEKGIFETPLPADLWEAYEEVIYKREKRLLDVLATPLTLDEIIAFRIIYGKPREPKESFEFGERALIGKHLERLIRQGKVAEEDGRYVRMEGGN